MDRSIIEQVFYGQRRSFVADNGGMTGDDDEVVPTVENGANIVRGKVTGTMMQLESVNGDLVFPTPKAAWD
jgi:hypothetical protein